MDALEAASKAVEHAKTLFPSAIPGTFLLEEVESTNRDGADVWNVTVSFYLERQRPNNISDLASALRSPHEKFYKQFFVRDSDGKVLSMKIRELTKLPA